MLLLTPRVVRFGDATWEDVSAVVVDRAARRKVVEWSDMGPHVALADVPEQEVTLRVVQSLARDAPDGPKPGDAGELSFDTSPAGTDAARRRVRAQAVVLDVRHELSVKGGATRTVTLVAVSPDGAADPLIVEEAG